MFFAILLCVLADFNYLINLKIRKEQEKLYALFYNLLCVASAESEKKNYLKPNNIFIFFKLLCLPAKEEFHANLFYAKHQCNND